MWYIVIALASMRGERSLRSSSAISSSRPNVLRWPQVSSDCVEQPGAERAVADADDLVHEAVKEDGVARLVDLLRRQEVLLLLQRGGVDVGRQVVGDGVLAVEEQRVEPQRAAPLLGRELLVPVDAVLREVDLRGRPVAALPAGVQIGVVDLLRRSWNRHGHRQPPVLGKRKLAGWPVTVQEQVAARDRPLLSARAAPPRTRSAGAR
jgi:hypothetical protein